MERKKIILGLLCVFLVSGAVFFGRTGNKVEEEPGPAYTVEGADSLKEEPVLTDEDFVMGIRPESIGFSDTDGIDSVIYGAMPTGMESAIKAAVGDYLLTSVIFGNLVYKIGEHKKLGIEGNNILLFDRKSGKRIASGSLEIR